MRALGLCNTKGSRSILSSKSHSVWKICRNAFSVIIFLRNVYLEIIFPVVKKVSVWKSFNLDYILDKGDRVFQLVGLQDPFEVDELQLNADMEGDELYTVIWSE